MQGKGFTPENPICRSGKSGIDLYVTSLKCPSGSAFSSKFRSSHFLPYMVDEYLLKCNCGKNHTVSLFFDTQRGQSVNASELRNVGLDQILLKSDRGINYEKLRVLLASQNWREADFETYMILSKIGGWQMGDLTFSWTTDIKKIPCADLITIDNLWVEASGGRFGFSPQKRIFKHAGGRLVGYIENDNAETAWHFGELIGWFMRSHRDGGLGEPGMWRSIVEMFTWDISAPLGHLPVLADDFGPKVIGIGVSLESFYYHIETCTYD